MSMDTKGASESSQPVEKTITVIGFGRRLAATIVDGVLVGVAGMALGAAVGVIVGLIQGYTPNTDIPVDAYIVFCGLVFSVAYYVGFWQSSGQTVGNMFLGIKVVGADGKPVSLGKALLRYVGYIISAVVWSLGFLWAAFDRKRQGWHDKIAGTYVVFVEANFSDVDAVKLVPSDPKRSWIWLGVWVVAALISPSLLLAGVFALGPYVSVAINSFLRGLGG